MATLQATIQAMTECFEHPIDRLAGAVIAVAVFDATNQVHRKTNRNNSRHKKNQARKKRQARAWLQEHGVYWLEALELEPEAILEAIHDH
jgi:hypothetical protein